VHHRSIGRLAWIEPKLLQQAPNADAGSLVTDANPHRAILVMNAHGDHRPLEARVGHSRHRQEKFAGQEGGLTRHARTMGRSRVSSNT